ncbi:MAG: PAS domain S-box protein [Deltaproteobacteria bacterium]|nr:PAS domain S-box protein [Deltaproteobacteria bacterium]
MSVSWLFPAVISTSIACVLLSAAYAYLYFIYRKKYLALWSVSWGVFALKDIFMLLMLAQGKTPALYFADMSMVVVSLYFLYLGTTEFIDQKVSPLWKLLFVCILAWTALAVFADFSFLMLTVPLYGFAAGVDIWVGYKFLRSKLPAGLGKTVVGVTLILWGLHKADYPFLRPVAWFAPYGYMIAATSAVIIALGMLILFFEKMRAELAGKETQLRQLFDEAIYGIALANPETGIIIDCNSAFADMLERDRTEIIGKYQREFHPVEEHTEGVSRTFKQHCGEKSGQSLESRMVTASGRIIEVEIRGKLINLGDQQVVQGFFKDITEHKMAEAEATRRRAEFEAIFNSITDAILFVDRERQFVAINPAFTRIFGYRLDELSGQTTQIIYADPEKFVEQGKIRFNPQAGGDKSLFENDYRRKDKTVFIGETLGVKVEDQKGELLGFLGVIRDVSARKRAEQERELLLSAIEQAAETIVMTDHKGTIQYANPAFEQITGYPPEEAIGQNPRILKSGEHNDTFYQTLWETITTGKIWSGRLVNKKKDGTLYTEEATISPVSNAAGEITNFVAVKRDISQEIILEKQLRLVQKLEVIGTLANGIAHDFNNILAPIIGYTHLMHEQKGRDDQDYKRLSVIMSSAQRARKLVEQILNFSCQAEEELHPLQLKTQIEETVTLLRATIPATIEFSLELQDLQVLASASHIHQVVMNLCTNAAHAMRDSSGRLTIELQRTELESGNLEILSPGCYALLSIHDSGPGIAPDVLPHIFDPYFTTKAIGEGSGIGLATVQRIVTSLGGNIRVESRLGQGCSFYLLLPIIQKSQPEQSTLTSLALPEGNKHLLLVDDEKSLVSISSEFLQDLGYRVTAFTDSREALRAFEQQPEDFDLLITDLTMPGLTGVELSQRVNKICPELPIILCTGQKESFSKQGLNDINLLKILLKPDLFTELAFSIHQHFDS